MNTKTLRTSTLPILRSAKGSPSSAALIVELLATGTGMTLTELHSALFDHFRYRISYQGVRKIVLGLLADEIIKHENDKFSLNRQWLLDARGAIDRLLNALSISPGSRRVASLQGLDLYTANSLFSADTLWGELLVQICDSYKGGGRVLSLSHYAFWMPVNTGRETELFSELQKKGWQTCFCFSRHTKLNDWSIKWYRAMGVRAKIADFSSIPETVYYNVVKDSIIEVTLDFKLASLAKKIASKAPGKFSVEELHSLSLTRGEVQFKVFNNQILADSLRELVSEKINP